MLWITDGDNQEYPVIEDEAELKKGERMDRIALLIVVIPILILIPLYFINHSLASSGLLLLAFWLFYSLFFFGGSRPPIGLRISGMRESFASSKYLFALGILFVFPISIIIESHLPPLGGFSISFLDSPFSYVYYTLILSPGVEEFVFRGVLQYRLRWFIPDYMANGLTSIAFVIIHWIPGELWIISIVMTLRFIRSFLYGHIFTKTQNVVHSWTIHFTFNLYEPVLAIILVMSGFMVL